ncbi:hypothetical protein Salmuc_01846 [Salipiger mucosus DSM 16094]|uniref:Uncharacterized protein n=2 Tax=Salipiger mucosus TaxID=263378 RepID=S9QRQ9_9RHOB|nr:hypothetical protein Salmuc_01846 [Salipiger mucosus DSM 16094]
MAIGIGLVFLGIGVLHATRFHAFTYLSLYEKTLAGLLLVVPSGWVAIRTTGLIIDRASLEQLEIALLNMGVFVGGIAWFLWCYRRQAVYSLSMQGALIIVHAGYLYKGWIYDTFAGKVALTGHVAALIGLLILFRHARTRQKFEKGARAFLARLD